MNIAALDLNLLVVFEALLLERGVGRAGKRIGLSQPAVSNALGRLRAVLGDELFVRTGTAMMPTSRALELSKPVLGALAQIRAAVGDREAFDPAKADIPFRFYASDYGEAIVIAPLLSRVRAVAPNVSLQIRRATALFNVPTEELVANVVDYAIGFYPDSLAPGSGLRRAALMKERLCVVTGTKGPRTLTLGRFVRAPQIRVNVGRESPGLIDDALARRGMERKIAVTVPDFASIPLILAATDVIGVLPERLAKLYGRRFNLRIHKLPLDIPALTVSAVWHERNDAHPAHVWLRSLMR